MGRIACVCSELLAMLAAATRQAARSAPRLTALSVASSRSALKVACSNVKAHQVSPWLSMSRMSRFFSAGGNIDAVQSAIDSGDVVIFYSATCGFCAQSFDALNEEKIAYKAVEITPELKAALLQRTGKTSVPSAWVKGTYVGGCNNGVEDWHGVVPMLKSGKLQAMLAE